MKKTVFLLFCFVVLIGCIGNDPNMDYKSIEFVIPDGFSGPFAVIERPDGIELNTNSRKCSIIVPERRILAVTSAELLREMRQWSAITASRQRISVYEVADNAIALRGGGYADRTGHVPRFEFFVGTLQEFENFAFSKWVPDDGILDR